MFLKGNLHLTPLSLSVQGVTLLPFPPVNLHVFGQRACMILSSLTSQRLSVCTFVFRERDVFTCSTNLFVVWFQNMYSLFLYCLPRSEDVISISVAVSQLEQKQM